MSHETRPDRVMQRIETPNECDRNTAWVSLHCYTTEQIKAEIQRREDASTATKALAGLCGSWEVAGVVAARAGLPRAQCVVGLFLLARDGKAQYRKAGSVTVWRLVKALADRQDKA